MPIKTLHITNAYHSASGGIRAFYRALLEAANRRGRLMRLVVPGERSEVEEVGSCGRIYHVAARRAFLFDNRYRLLAPATYLPPFRGELWRILRDERPDLIEVCDKYSIHWMAGLLRRGWISGLRRTPLVGMSCERMDDNIILLTTYTTVTERTRQIGILKALGASKRFIALVFIKESMLVSATGVAGGLIIALIARLALAAWAGLRIEIEIGYTLCAALGGLASGLMGAIYPALRAAGQDAVEALSYE